MNTNSVPITAPSNSPPPPRQSILQLLDAQVVTPSFPPGQVQPLARELTNDEKVTIGMACNDYQMRGDISGFQSCMRNQTARAQAGGVIPSTAHLTIEEKVTIGMACNDYQMSGDISGFQSCMRAQIGKTVR